MRILKALGLILFISYALVLILIYIFQDKMIFYPEKLPLNFKYNLSPLDTEVFIKTIDGVNINGILYRRPGNKYVILYFHGNAGSLGGWQDVSNEILALNSDLLIIDNRGYGKSEDSFSEKGFYEDGRAALRFLISAGYKADQVILYGRSLGTGIASELAITENVKGLILETPYTSLKDLANERMSYFLPSLLMQYNFNTLQNASKFSVPTLILHGSKDDLIPFSHSQKIYDAIAGKKKLVLIEGGKHNNLNTYPEHQQALSDFLNSL
ncbi:MAG: alpha/beta hydrolase [Bacteroidota bacterium]|nr:alpha/beta hydrolase [Bacteroidota bacterium]